MTDKFKKVYVIAEAGVNHNGSLDLAFKLIDVAAKAGADAVKFQTFKAKNIAANRAPKAEYQEKTTNKQESQQEMLKKYELGLEEHQKLFVHCKKKNIEFLSSPFDIESLDLLVNELGLSKIKIPSGEIANGPLLLKTAQLTKDIILSTGMSTLADIENALGALAFGYLKINGKPNLSAFQAAYHSADGKRCLKEHIILLHCITAYPAPVRDVNLRAMDVMRKQFELPVGYSDHTVGINVPIAAVAYGAKIIEKHFTLDRGLPGPDHQASLEPNELTAMVGAIREVEQAMGRAEKFVTQVECDNVNIARKSIVASRVIKKGERFTAENLAIKRPGFGLSPMLYWDLWGKKAEKDYEKDMEIIV